MESEHDELKGLLEENLQVAKETNKLIKDMRRDALIGGVLKTVIWVVLLFVSFYFSMQFLAPYLSMLEGIQGEGGMDFNALFEQYQAQFGQ